MLRLAPLAALLILALSPGAFAQGALTFETPVHEFGSFNEGEEVTHVFRFTNTGDAPITLTDVRASCGCTTPSYTTDAVAPGGAGEITVVYDSAGRPGPFTKRVTVEAGGEAMALQIRGTVVPDFANGGVAQGHFLFAADSWESVGLEPGALLQHGFRFQNTSDKPLRILSTRSPKEGVEIVTPNRIIFPGDVAVVMVTVDDPAALAAANGAVDVAVLVETNDEVQPVKSLRLLGRVLAPRAAVN